MLNVEKRLYADLLQNFVELYDLNKDPHQLTNIAGKADPKLLVMLNNRLTSLAVCAGAACRKPADHWMPSA